MESSRILTILCTVDAGYPGHRRSGTRMSVDEQDGKPLPGIPDSQLHLSDVDALVRETGKLPTAAVRQHPLFGRIVRPRSAGGAGFARTDREVERRPSPH